MSSPLTVGANGDFSLKFLAKDQHDVTKTLIKVTAAEVEDVHGFVVHPSVPVVSTVLIHDAHPLVPAKVSMTLADVSVKTEMEFDMVLAITTTEALTDLRMNLAYDTALLTLKSGVLNYTGNVPSSVKLRFYAKENHTVGSTKVTVSPVSGTDHNGLAAELPAEVSGTVILADSNPWVPAVVGVSVGSVKTDTLCEFELPVTVTSNETLTHFTGEVAWDESVVELRGIDGRAVNAPVSPYRFETSGGNFKLKFFAKNQHAVTKTNVRLSGMTAVDVHGLTANPIADALGVVLIHDAQPLVPAGVAMNVSKVYSDTLSTFALPIVITSTKTLTNLTVNIGWDATALEFRSVANGRMDGQTLTVSGTVPSTIYLTFYAKDQHKITETTVTLSGASARCIDGLAAKITTVNGTVYLTDANAPVPVEMTVATWHSKVKSGEAFKVPIGATTSGDLATLTVDVDWDASQLTFVGCPSAKSVTTLAANARRFIFDCTGNYNVFNLDFKAPVIAGLQAGSWTRVTAASGVGRNGLTAVVKTDLPRTGNVMIVREVGKYDPGDIDGDGAYTANDLLILNGYVVYLKMAAKGAVFGESYATTYLKQYGVNVKLTGSAARAADVNCDGSVDTSDIAMLQMLIKEAEGVGK